MSNLLMLNFGTIAENARFKARAIESNFISTDLMQQSNPPGSLIATDKKLRKISDRGTVIYSFWRLMGQSWRGKLMDGRNYRDVFKDWMTKVLRSQVNCLYLAGHHWAYGDSEMFLSWGDTSDYFHIEFETSKKKIGIGTGRGKYLLDLPADNLRSKCYLVLGFGCNVCTGINSMKYQKFFSGKGTTPIILGWNSNISLPRRNAGDKRFINKRFFDYLDKYIAGERQVPSQDRLAWFYNNEPMEIIRAWGFATTYWNRSISRARGKDGSFYKFRMDKAKEYAVPDVIRSKKTP